MGRKLALALVSSLVMVGAVFANAGPPPLPKGHKVAEPPVRFEGIDKHPDYIFHLHYYGLFLEGGLVEVKGANAIKLDFKTKDRTPNLSYMGLKAMERKEFAKRKQADPKLKWFGDFKAEGVLAAKLDPPKTTAPIDGHIQLRRHRPRLGSRDRHEPNSRRAREKRPVRGRITRSRSLVATSQT